MTARKGVRGTWMRDFIKVADERGYRMDYIGVHWYGGPSPTAFKQRMVEIYKAYGERPLLITEFCPRRLGCKNTPAEFDQTRGCDRIHEGCLALDGTSELDRGLCVVFVRN